MMTAVYLQSLTECLNGSGLCLLRISPFRQALGSLQGLLTSFSWLHDPSLFKSVLACPSVSNVFITSSIHYSLTLRPCNRAKPRGTKLWQYTGEFRESRGRTMSINWAPTHMPAVASFWVWNREENMLEINQSPSLLWPVLFFFFFSYGEAEAVGDTSLTSAGWGGSLEAQAAFLCCCPQKTSDFALMAFSWLDKAHP